MKICDSCGKLGGEHTPFCKYQNKNPDLLEVHPTHKVLGTGKCIHCDRGDVPGLTLECAKYTKPEGVTPTSAKEAEEKPIFPIDSTHQTQLDDGVWRCVFCGGFTQRMLEKPCTKKPEEFNFGGMEVHPSHRMKWDDGSPVNCEACGASMPAEIVTECPAATPEYLGASKIVESGITGRLPRGARRFTPSYKGTLLPDDKVWAIYYWEQQPIVVSIHARPEQAINANTLNNSIFPWKLGTDFGEAVRAWEKRNSEEEKKE